MVWGGISITCKKQVKAISITYPDKILQPVAIAYLHNLGPNPILQDDNAPLGSCMPSGGAPMPECPLSRSDH